MAFAFDGACNFVIPRRAFDSGSPLYKIIILEGYVYSSVEVVEASTGETIDTTILNYSRTLTTTIRLESKYLTPGKVLYFMTPERIMPKVYIRSDPPGEYTVPIWSGVVRGGFNVWKWEVPS